MKRTIKKVSDDTIEITTEITETAKGRYTKKELLEMKEEAKRKIAFAEEMLKKFESSR